MKQYQLFTRKPGQQPSGNKYAIFDTFQEAQTELRSWFKSQFSNIDNIVYLDDKIIKESSVYITDYQGYEGSGWYKCQSDSFYELIYSLEQIESPDFMRFFYDGTEYYIQEMVVICIPKQIEV